MMPAFEKEIVLADLLDQTESWSSMAKIRVHRWPGGMMFHRNFVSLDGKNAAWTVVLIGRYTRSGKQLNFSIGLDATMSREAMQHLITEAVKDYESYRGELLAA